MYHRRIYASPGLNKCSVTPLYDILIISLCVCIYFIQCLFNVTLTSDFICIYTHSYQCPFKHDFILIIVLMNTIFVYYLCVFYITLSYQCICCVFTHLCIEKSGTIATLFYNVPTISKKKISLLLPQRALRQSRHCPSVSEVSSRSECLWHCRIYGQLAWYETRRNTNI